MQVVQIEELITHQKPGWKKRLFHIMTGNLIALDVEVKDGQVSRGENFDFLYKDREGNYYHLKSELNWELMDVESARLVYSRLMFKIKEF